MDDLTRIQNRRRFLAYMAGSALLGSGVARAQSVLAEPQGRLPDPMLWSPRRLDPLIATPADAIDVFDFEGVARAKVPPAHFGYMASGIDDEATLRANREDFARLRLRSRRLVDVSHVDMSMRLFGETFPTPIIIAPAGGHRAFHSDGEAGVARAARAGNHMMILSSQTSTPIADVIAARGQPLWFQLYPTNSFDVAKALLDRAEQAGCHAVAITVDSVARRNQETLIRMRRADPRVCSACHNTPTGPGLPDAKRTPMWAGIDLSGLPSIQSSALDWDKLKRIRDATRMRCAIKGILTAEDAKLVVAHGFDAIIVSNHGGRVDDSGLSTIEALPPIAAAVRGRIPILIDSGFRRGTDIVKAIGLGATGVAIGRPYLWGLGAFGESGVARVLELLRAELLATMQQMGAPSLKAITPGMIQHV
jgi:isopentenyl diphosphate isomerase/L-lactate dehydrogenase-like FMN-dependent dehydrogenase